MNDELYIDPSELKSLDLFEALMKLANANMEKMDLKAQLLKVQYEKEVSVFRGRRRDEQGAYEEAQAQYVAARKAVEDRLGVSLNDFAVSESGRLEPLPE